MHLTADVGETTLVQVARESRFDGEMLTLIDLAPATVLVAPGLAGRVSHVPTGLFLDLWYLEHDGTALREVSGVLTLMDPDAATSVGIDLVLSLPRIRESGLEYRARVISGFLPHSSGACVLVIGPVPTPRRATA